MASLTPCTLGLRVLRNTVIYAIRPEVHGETLTKTLQIDCEVESHSEWIEQNLIGTKVAVAISNGLKRASDQILHGRVTYSNEGELLVSLATRDEPYMQTEAFVRSAEGLTLTVDFKAPSTSHAVSLFGPMPIAGFALQTAPKTHQPAAALRLVDSLG